MKGKVLLGVFASALILGCGGGSDSPEAKRYEIQKALNEGNYDFVIATLEGDPTYGGVFTENEGKLNLAAAYLGKAGYDPVDIIKDVLEAGTQNADTALIQAFAKRVSGRNLALLKKALNIYESMKPQDCQSAVGFYQKEACFYFGLVNGVQATSSIALAVGGITGVEDTQELVDTVQTWIDAVQQGTAPALDCNIDLNQNGIPDPTDISACAIEYGASDSSNLHYTCASGAKVTGSQDLTFKKNGKSFNFEYITVEISSSSGCSGLLSKNILLTNQTPRTPVVTDGYCTTGFTPCDPNTDAACYPCPVVITDDQGNENVLDAGEVIVDAINNIDSLADIVSSGDQAQQNEIRDALVEVRRNICEADPSACTCDGQTCTSTNIQSAQDVKINDISVISDYLTNTGGGQ